MQHFVVYTYSVASAVEPDNSVAYFVAYEPAGAFAVVKHVVAYFVASEFELEPAVAFLAVKYSVASVVQHAPFVDSTDDVDVDFGLGAAFDTAAEAALDSAEYFVLAALASALVDVDAVDSADNDFGCEIFDACVNAVDAEDMSVQHCIAENLAYLEDYDVAAAVVAAVSVHSYAAAADVALSFVG